MWMLTLLDSIIFYGLYLIAIHPYWWMHFSHSPLKFSLYMQLSLHLSTTPSITSFFHPLLKLIMSHRGYYVALFPWKYLNCASLSLFFLPVMLPVLLLLMLSLTSLLHLTPTPQSLSLTNPMPNYSIIWVSYLFHQNQWLL